MIAVLAISHIEHSAGTFDSTKSTIFTCPGMSDGSSGYPRTQFQNGVLHPELGSQGQAGYLALPGSIQPDGTAALAGQGLTGNLAYAVGRPSPTTPYTFHLQSRFTPTQGIR